MKISSLCLSLLLILLLSNNNVLAVNSSISKKYSVQRQDSVLRHVVLFKFKSGTSSLEIDRVREAFVGLQGKIPQILSLEWGVNNSPEGLDRGFTHCFFLTFRDEKDRDTYLPHPDHKAFGTLLGPILEDVLVVDYWTH